MGDRLKGDQYTIVKKLGWGHFSTVWLCKDAVHTRYVAIKVVKSASHYTETALDEIKILERIRDQNPESTGRQRVVELLDHFFQVGPHGKHVCMVFEVLGENLLTIIRRHQHRGMDVQVVKRIALQMLQSLDYLHRECTIIHTDLKPENVLLCMDDYKLSRKFGVPLLNAVDVGRGLERNMSAISLDKLPEDSPTRTPGKRNHSPRSSTSSSTEHPPSKRSNSPAKSIALPANNHSTGTLNSIGSTISTKPFDIKLADLGNACWVDFHFTSDIQTRQYRCPEVIIGAEYGTSADIWSVACLMFELLTGDYLFDPRNGDSFDKNDDHLAQIIELVGQFPKQVALSGENSSSFFNSRGDLKLIHKFKFWSLTKVLSEKYHFSLSESSDIASFLEPMLRIRSADRASARECLQHPWLNL